MIIVVTASWPLLPRRVRQRVPPWHTHVRPDRVVDAVLESHHLRHCGRRPRRNRATAGGPLQVSLKQPPIRVPFALDSGFCCSSRSGSPKGRTTVCALSTTRTATSARRNAPNAGRASSTGISSRPLRICRANTPKRLCEASDFPTSCLRSVSNAGVLTSLSSLI